MGVSAFHDPVSFATQSSSKSSGHGGSGGGSSGEKSSGGKSSGGTKWWEGDQKPKPPLVTVCHMLGCRGSGERGMKCSKCGMILGGVAPKTKK